MNTTKAIISFSQCEKIKSGLLWAIHLSQMRQAIPENQRQGADKYLESLIELIGHEVQILKNMAWEKAWEDVSKSIDMALVMIRSKVPEESGYHLTHAVTRVTGLGHNALSFLKEQGCYDY